MTSPECFRFGAPASHHFGNGHLCADCVPIDGVTTPREYYREGRGWDDATIDAKRLGYAPASPDALLNHLMGEGYDRETILGAGLFWSDGLDPIWCGRLVLPYTDGDGRSGFAISRRIGDGGHPADGAGQYGPEKAPAKYHKIPDQDCTAVAEPIYGVASIESGAPVLITEGIADAITAHQAGYACLSPVTTTFKKADRDHLVDVLEAHDVPRVVIVQDAERPGSELAEAGDGWDSMTVSSRRMRSSSATARPVASSTIPMSATARPIPRFRRVNTTRPSSTSARRTTSTPAAIPFGNDRPPHRVRDRPDV